MAPHTLTFQTPIPPSLSRQAVILATQDHASMLRQNPMMVSFRKVPAAPTSPKVPEAEKTTYTWYRVTDRIQLIPGVGFASTQVEFDAGFLDVEDGMRTHVLAPMGVELRSYWKVVPGEAEGGGAGLVLREETEVQCSAVLAGFVKRNINESHSKTADKVLANAETKAGDDSL